MQRPNTQEILLHWFVCVSLIGTYGEGCLLLKALKSLNKHISQLDVMPSSTPFQVRERLFMDREAERRKGEREKIGLMEDEEQWEKTQGMGGQPELNKFSTRYSLKDKGDNSREPLLTWLRAWKTPVLVLKEKTQNLSPLGTSAPPALFS